MDMEQGARIIVEDWLAAKREEVFLFVTDEHHMREADAFVAAAEKRGVITKVKVLPSDQIQSGLVLDSMKEVMSHADVIIGATDSSFITTDAVGYALKHNTRFLSLPLSTNSGKTLLECAFIGMDVHKAERMSKPLIRRLNRRDGIRAETALGTSVTFSKAGLNAHCLSGITNRRRMIGSASFEVCVPIDAYSAEGTVVLDGSLGYIGLVHEPLRLTFRKGVLTDIADTPDGKRLTDYLRSFDDPRMYHACEFGIGLNELSRCSGDSYIEDESAFGTFHIGMGRNLSIGGTHDAKGHFDIVIRRPDLYAGDRMIMQNGVPTR